MVKFADMLDGYHSVSASNLAKLQLTSSWPDSLMIKSNQLKSIDKAKWMACSIAEQRDTGKEVQDFVRVCRALLRNSFR